MLSLSSNGEDTSSAIVWACFPTSGNANQSVRPGTLAAYNANDVSANELWYSDQDSNNVIGSFAKFNAPTVANGKVYVGTFSKKIKVYGVYPPADTAKCINNGTGLLAEYFSRTASSAPFPATPTITKTEPAVNFNWGMSGPSGISVDSFKIRFSGQVQSLDSGAYTFYVTSDDGYRLWINNQLIMDKWVNKSASEDSVSITLSKCTKYNIKLEYFDNRYDAVCILKWRGPSTVKQIIPTSQLYSTNTQLRSASQSATIRDQVNSNSSDKFIVYPNPNGTHILTISTGISFSSNSEISIYNILGQKAMTKSLSVTDVKNKEITIPINLSPGIYIIRLVTDNRIYSSKFIVW